MSKNFLGLTDISPQVGSLVTLIYAHFCLDLKEDRKFLKSLCGFITISKDVNLTPTINCLSHRQTTKKIIFMGPHPIKNRLYEIEKAPSIAVGRGKISTWEKQIP